MCLLAYYSSRHSLLWGLEPSVGRGAARSVAPRGPPPPLWGLGPSRADWGGMDLERGRGGGIKCYQDWIIKISTENKKTEMKATPKNKT